MNSKIQKIGVFTSGGDSPGMNAAIRAVVRSTLSQGMECVGIYRGYEGMIDGEFEPMVSQSVSNIIQRGGTILKSARSARFREKAGRDLGALFTGGNRPLVPARTLRGASMRYRGMGGLLAALLNSIYRCPRSFAQE